MSRLDRLLVLLESGSTPSVRHTAARQLADLAALRVAHPSLSHSANAAKQEDDAWRGIDGEWNQVIHLVERILPFLSSKSFETRQAAATALAYISKAVGVWDPSNFALPDQEGPVIDTQKLALADFSLTRLLSHGQTLLSSSGTEFAQVSSMTAEELAKAQKEAMGKLGLGDISLENDLGVDMQRELAGSMDVDPPAPASAPPLEVKPISLPPPKFLNDSSNSTVTQAAKKSSPVKVKSEPEELQEPPEEPTGNGGDPYSGLSARERNKLKRKRKNDAKTGVVHAPPAKVQVTATRNAVPSNPAPPSPVKDEEMEDSKPDIKSEVEQEEKVVIDPGKKAREKLQEGGEITVEGEGTKSRMEVKEGEWPWRGTIDRLQVDLLSPLWETRHGAALGLRELLKLQGCSGGKFAGNSTQINNELHRKWCEDLSTTLLAVLALDRFADYVSDQVIAPVRETTAQALGTLLTFMPDESVLEVERVLIEMVDQFGAPPSSGIDGNKKASAVSAKKAGKLPYFWQVRHSGLLTLKYLVAVKGDLLRTHKSEDGALKEPLRAAVGAAILGLQDGDDDVRSSAAATISPVADAVVTSLSSELRQIIILLWECLGELKDDLSSSVGSVMDLLAKMLAFPQVLSAVQTADIHYTIDELVPRLFPFFRHTITSVRLAVLNTLIVFLELPGISHAWADERLHCLVFQNLVVEERQDILDASNKTWDALLNLSRTDASHLKKIVPYLSKWFAILDSPIGKPMNRTLFWSTQQSSDRKQGYNVDKAILSQDLTLISAETILRGRIGGATAVGKLAALWSSDEQRQLFEEPLNTRISSKSSLQVIVSCVIVEEWANASSHENASSSPLAKTCYLSLTKGLFGELPTEYTEMAGILPRIRDDSVVLYNILKTQGKVSASKIPSIASAEHFGIVHAKQVDSGFAVLLGHVGKNVPKTTVTAIQDQHRKVASGIGYWEGVKSKYDRQVGAVLGAAIISLRSIPPKLTPLIRSLTTSLKEEEDAHLQTRSAKAIACLIDICSSPESTLKANPSDKIIKNLCAFLCQDVSKTPMFEKTKDIKDKILTLEYKPARGLEEKEAKNGVTSVNVDKATAELVHRGAQLALSELSYRFGADLILRVPILWKFMSESLLKVYGKDDVEEGDRLLGSSDKEGQDLLDCLTVLPTGAEKAGKPLESRLKALFPALACAARSSFPVVRYCIARCFALLCDVLPEDGLGVLVDLVVPVLGDPLNVDHRRGAIEMISHAVELLDIKILPYVIFLVVPVLGRMSDPDDEIRLMATNTFATLVKLVPLEAGLPDPPGFSAEMLQKRQEEREFLMQLLDGSKVVEYKLPITISIDLRKYQREGVSWLAFLAKYQLHGLLCDDMGLGKTLQSICILASKHFERAERHKVTGSVDSVHLPSLVVCPPTLTGHWKQEIMTYAPFLKPTIYSGPKIDRKRLVSKLRGYDVVITSYDIVRNDIEWLSPIDWHYCILDEGHIIKNGKTKLTKSVKQLRAIHRLILSGTPIQNNVLELWSLFDFLMPGFLGSEQSFNERFGKPIAASRDAKSSSKDQEKGSLALEALHKQVLPFLLRRLKEDVLDDLPPKIIQDYYCELSPLQKMLYDDFSSSQAKQLVDGEVKSSSDSGPPQHVFQALQYLRKLVNHPALVMKPEVERHQAIIKSIQEERSSIRDIKHAPKLQALRQILLDCGIGKTEDAPDTTDSGVAQHRVLIFCQLKQMLDIVENDLFKKEMPSVTYMRMDGSTPSSKRHAVVQTFNADPSIDVLLLTTHVGGLGLNLTSADTVIFVEHDWNPMKDLQAMDRAHRLGQKRVVNVYRLITRGTLEEKIMGLQRFKLNIASSVVTQQNSDLSTLGTDSILDLFTVSAEGEQPTQKEQQDDKPKSRKAILEGLQSLGGTEDEYQDLDLTSFTSTL